MEGTLLGTAREVPGLKHAAGARRPAATRHRQSPPHGCFAIPLIAPRGPDAASPCLEAPFTDSLDSSPERRHARCQDGLRKLAGAADRKGTEILVPIAIGCPWASLDPILQSAEILERNPTLLYAGKDVLPDRPRKTRESYLRQWRRSRKPLGSGPSPLRPFAGGRPRTGTG